MVLCSVIAVTGCHLNLGTEVSTSLLRNCYCCYFIVLSATYPITNQSLVITSLFFIYLQDCHFEICQWNHGICKLFRLFKLSKILLRFIRADVTIPPSVGRMHATKLFCSLHVCSSWTAFGFNYHKQSCYEHLSIGLYALQQLSLV